MERAWQGLVSFVLFLSATLHGVVSPSHPHSPATAQNTAQVSSAIPRVDFFGDSVSWESKHWILAALSHRAQAYPHVFPGTSLCMWFPQMRQAAAQHPAMVLLTFGPEFQAPCDHTTDRFREMQDDAGTAAEIFSGSKVIFATDPARKNDTALQGRVYAAYEAAAKAHKNASVSYPDRVVAPGDVFSEYLPCLPDETAAMGCITAYGQRVIKIRAPDNMHLCPIIPPIPGECPVYASGERRFGVAVAAPAIAAFPYRPEAIPVGTS
jgi:hypothetical protein